MKRFKDGSQWWYLDIPPEYDYIIVSNQGSHSVTDISYYRWYEGDLYINNEGFVIGDRP